MGAYAQSTGKIYLNADWVKTATQKAIDAVLTQELGHFLDGLLNSSDTPGDEGELFAALLHSGGVISAQQRERLLIENDQSFLYLTNSNYYFFTNISTIAVFR
jgi:hypothetical protein